MVKKNTGSWMESHKFTVAVIVMLIVWGSLLTYLVIYSEGVLKDPCSICAERMGEKVICTAGDSILSYKTFYENGTIKVDIPSTNRLPIPGLDDTINFSLR